MNPLSYRELVRFSDDLKLAPDETVSACREALEDALETWVPFPSGTWWLCDLASDWCVLAVDDPQGSRFFRVEFTRDDAGAFTLSGMAEVERELSVSYEPLVPGESEEAEGGTTDAFQADAVVAHNAPHENQRADLPDAAYAMVLKRGKGMAPRRALPHHINSVTDPMDHATVDLPRLRANLSRAAKVEGATKAQIRAGLQHLETHASHLKVGRFRKDAEEVDELIRDMVKAIDAAHDHYDPLDLSWVDARVEKLTKAAIARRAAPTAPAILSLQDRAKALGIEEFTDRQLTQRLAVGPVVRLTDAQVKVKKYPKNAPATAAFPDGKPFLGVYRAGLTVMGIINVNRYLYPALDVMDNVNRLCDAVQKAYTHDPATGPNMHVAQLIGEADHPTDETGTRTQASCTMMLDCMADGSDVSFVFGLIDTSVGRDMQALWDSGMPVATSMRSQGRGTLMEMNADDAHWTQNQDRVGEPYLRISPLLIKAGDLVVEPASWTYVEQQLSSLDPARRAELQSVIDRVRTGGLITDSKTGGALPPDNRSQEDTVEKEALAALLKGLTRDQLRDSVSVEALDAASPLALSLKDKVAGLETELADAKKNLAASEATRATLQTVVDAVEADKKRVEAEKTEMARVQTLKDAIEKRCEGLPWADARKKYLQTILLADATATPEGIEKVNSAFEADFGAYIAAADAAPKGPKLSEEGKDKEVVVPKGDADDALGGLKWSKAPVA